MAGRSEVPGCGGHSWRAASKGSSDNGHGRMQAQYGLSLTPPCQEEPDTWMFL